jgi:RNA polymerase sigma-70 factor (ECF subfamily)
MIEPDIRGETGGFSNQEIERLFLENYDALYAAAHRVVGNAEDAEDVVQNLFLKLLQSNQSGRPPEIGANPKGYLYRAAVNEARMLVRSRRRRKEVDGFEDIEIPAPGNGRMWDNIKDRLENVFASLKPEAAEIVELHYTHGYSDAEIAAMKGQSRVKIASILNRSRAKVQQLLGQNKSKKEE